MASGTVHDVFYATLRIEELVHIESEWTIRVFDDDTLTVAIQRPVDWRTQEASADERLERELLYSYVSYDGTATRFPSSVSSNSSVVSRDRPGDYTIHFYLAKCGPEGESWTVEVRGTLGPTHGLCCTWRHETHQDYELWQSEFENGEERAVPVPRSWRAAVEPVLATVSPLTVGTYSLEGSLMDDENFGFIVPITVELILLADGSITGTSTSAWGSTRDDDEPEIAKLSGSWTRDRVELIQSFEFADTANEVFALHGQAGAYGITGEWAVVELEALGDWEDSEHQRFHLRVTNMTRPWSPEEHTFFPTPFRIAARLCLLSSVRMDGTTVRLPSVLWPRVFAFCDSEWFLGDDR